MGRSAQPGRAGQLGLIALIGLGLAGLGLAGLGLAGCASPQNVVMRIATTLVLASVLLPACRTPLSAVSASSPPMADPAGPLDDAALVEQLVLGRQALRDAITRLETLPLPGEPVPRFVPLPELEQALTRRYARGTSLGPVHSLAVLGVIAWAPAPPQRVAGLWVHPDVMHRVLAAQQVSARGPVRRWPRAARRTLFVEKSGVGAGPLRTNLRFAIAMERVDLSSGDVWVRSDSDPSIPGAHVTLWRGLLHAAPLAGGQGSRITEVLVIGTDLRAPPLLEDTLRKQTLKTLRDSRVNLMKRAVGR